MGGWVDRQMERHIDRMPGLKFQLLPFLVSDLGQIFLHLFFDFRLCSMGAITIDSIGFSEEKGT